MRMFFVLLVASMLVSLDASADSRHRTKGYVFEFFEVPTGIGALEGINKRGDILGVFGSETGIPPTRNGVFVIDGATGEMSLLEIPGNFPRGFGINDSQQVAVTNYLGGATVASESYVWSPKSGDLQRLEPASPRDTQVIAFGLNNWSVVVGVSASDGVDFSTNRGVLWWPTYSTKVLKTIEPPEGFVGTVLLGINDRMQVVGSLFPNHEGTNFSILLWSPWHGVVNLGPGSSCALSEGGMVAAGNPSGSELCFFDANARDPARTGVCHETAPYNKCGVAVQDLVEVRGRGLTALVVTGCDDEAITVLVSEDGEFEELPSPTEFPFGAWGVFIDSRGLVGGVGFSSESRLQYEPLLWRPRPRRRRVWSGRGLAR